MTDSRDFAVRIGALGRSPSRRTMLRGLWGGSLLALRRLDEAGAKKKGKRKRKRGNKRCTCPAGSGKVCQGKDKACVCPAGEEESGGVCGTPPACGRWQEPCTTGAECCAQTCLPLLDYCAVSEAGETCYTADDCYEPNSICRGFVCVSP